MRIINFSDNTTYVSDGESYRLDGRNHNIQRIDKKWMVDGRATTFSEMIKMGRKCYRHYSFPKVCFSDAFSSLN